MARRVVMVHHPSGYSAIERRVQRVGQGVADAVAGDARRSVPVKTGYLRETIHTVQVSTFSWHVRVGTDHWQHMEYGTRGRNPVILPRLKKALWWPGLQNPIARVRKHPGNEAQPFMRPSLMQPRAFWFSPTGTLVVTK